MVYFIYCEAVFRCSIHTHMKLNIEKGEILMKVRIQTLWKVPVFCMVASWISFSITVYLGGFFFGVKTVDADGVTIVSTDPVRSAIFHTVIFLIIVLIGGLWAFRSMTKKEIAISAGIMSSIYLLIILAQSLFPNFPLELSVTLAYIQNWKGMISQFLMKLTDNIMISEILSSFGPLLFISFGRKEI